MSASGQRLAPVRHHHHDYRRRPVRVGRLAISVVLFVIGVLMVAPLVWMVSTSLTEPVEAFQLPPRWLPVPFSLQSFTDMAGLMPIGRMALNSLVVAVISVGGSLFTASLAAYSFSRIQFRGRNQVFLLLLSALMVPGQLTIIPIFILMRRLELVDTLAALWLPALINVFAIFFLRQYFNTIPRELDEAARIDGAGHLRILFQIMVPLAGPALSALAILGFESSWNNYFGPLIFLSTPEKMTLPIGLVTLSAGQGGGPAGVVFAGITMVVVPTLIVFVAFQRAFIESVASIGIRG
ncbi:multiple sugar transport system permease protein [Actinopolymorpha cephalotaxi]|uniref:Multiple sugar transport system permease protein n=1 Tax=Actinopolymorpha cephalotaxi TaxID=504797 RepID=A0A1I2TEY0_9ACTN|nr:carbohydrate ABC transporter permease [Actinopolymorpha cephalotaxi]NYH82997.1 multiple sugar transport system permease protein [Actinopolymorpha cephalotaxi]SFG61917.1 multiple sugar transport system permease protein [Actinopolymorpha cephalotaxi]